MTEIEKTMLAITIANDMLRINEKILAIKFVRLIYNTGLKQAKDFVEEIHKYSGVKL